MMPALTTTTRSFELQTDQIDVIEDALAQRSIDLLLQIDQTRDFISRAERSLDGPWISAKQFATLAGPRRAEVAMCRDLARIEAVRAAMRH